MSTPAEIRRAVGDMVELSEGVEDQLVCAERWPSPRCKSESTYCGEFGMCPETRHLLDEDHPPSSFARAPAEASA